MIRSDTRDLGDRPPRQTGGGLVFP